MPTAARAPRARAIHARQRARERGALYEAFEATIDRLEQWLGVRPAIVAHDPHPGHRATAYALARFKFRGAQTLSTAMFLSYLIPSTLLFGNVFA